jgi:ubiquinone/menaquinone biosynthesis C-methylase UbiE
LDIACGTGRLTFPLARYFAEVFAVDQEREMIDEGKRISSELNIGNIKWLTRKAEELDLSPESFQLITIGDAFHRFDQLRVLQTTFAMLARGGSLALVYSNPITKGETNWQIALREVLLTWNSVAKKNAQAGNDSQFGEFTLRAFGFEKTFSREYEETIEVTAEEIIGYLYSMSLYSKNVIGKNYRDFENRVTETLLKVNGENRFAFPFRCGYYVGKKGTGAL